MTLRCPEPGTARPCSLSNCSLIDCQLLQGFQTSLGGMQGLRGRALPTHTRCTLQRAASIVKAAAGWQARSQDDGNEELPSIGPQRLLKRPGKAAERTRPPRQSREWHPPANACTLLPRCCWHLTGRPDELHKRPLPLRAGSCKTTLGRIISEHPIASRGSRRRGRAEAAPRPPRDPSKLGQWRPEN